MPDWHAIGGGVCSLPVVVLLLLLVSPPLVVFAGFGCGFVAGLVAGGGWRTGLLHGVLTGVGVTALSVGVVLLYARYAAPDTANVYPGFGMSVFLGLVLSPVLGVESVVGGVAGGLLR